jgi:hypothetical protein
MGSLKSDTYRETVPEHVNKTQDEWNDLSYHAQYYHAENRRQKQNEDLERIKQEKREWINRIKYECGCSNCSENQPVCLDFHHVKEKENSISKLLHSNSSWERIKTELKSCIILCANCHRKSHNDIIQPKDLSRGSS